MFHNDNLLRSEMIFQLLMTGAVGAISSESLIRPQQFLQLRPHRTTKCMRCKYLIQSMELYVVDFYFFPTCIIMIHSFPALEIAGVITFLSKASESPYEQIKNFVLNKGHKVIKISYLIPRINYKNNQQFQLNYGRKGSEKDRNFFNSVQIPDNPTQV